MMQIKFNFNNFAPVCHILAVCQPSSLAAVIGLSNNDVISLRCLRRVRCMRCVGWKPCFNRKPAQRTKLDDYGVVFCRHMPSPAGTFLWPLTPKPYRDTAQAFTLPSISCCRPGFTKCSLIIIIIFDFYYLLLLFYFYYYYIFLLIIIFFKSPSTQLPSEEN